MSLLKTVGPAILLIASLCLAGAGCSSSPLKFTSNKKPKKSKQADTIPTAQAVGYTPNEAKSK